MPAVAPLGQATSQRVCEAEVARRARENIGVHVQRGVEYVARLLEHPSANGSPACCPLPAGGLSMEERGGDLITVYQATKAGQ